MDGILLLVILVLVATGWHVLVETFWPHDDDR